jgi:anaerobic ribonucleoside-triphosphate reductase activating protein
MLRYYNYDIVFQEVPGEVTLAVNLSNCPNACRGCHSAHLQEDVGAVLDETVLSEWLARYGSAITCLCFMGGDADPQRVAALAAFLREQTKYPLKIAWYSGKNTLPDPAPVACFDFIKLGAYREDLGGLSSPATNQRFYRMRQGEMIDETAQFQGRHEATGV